MNSNPLDRLAVIAGRAADTKPETDLEEVNMEVNEVPEKEDKDIGKLNTKELMAMAYSITDSPEEAEALIEAKAASSDAHPSRNINEVQQIAAYKFISKSNDLLAPLIMMSGRQLSLNEFMPLDDDITTGYARYAVLNVVNEIMTFIETVADLDTEPDSLTREMAYIWWHGVKQGWWAEDDFPPPDYNKWKEVFEEEAEDESV